MNRTKLFIGTAILALLLAMVIASPAYAWHPKGTIQKLVQNETTKSTMSDANDAKSAVTAKPGDILKYTIKVSNTGTADSRGYNDMAKTVMTDTLPAGVELVSNPAQRTIKVEMGTIKPGQTVTKEYQVKVTSKQDGTITNTACFTGDSTVNDAPQKGCDLALTKVNVPVTTPTPTPVTPVNSPAPVPVVEQPATLPSTGASNIFVPVLGVSILAFLGHHFYLNRRTV